MTESWTPLPKTIRNVRLGEIVSVRGPLLTFRQRNAIWVARAGEDPRAWCMKVDERGRGRGQWIHTRPWIDELIRAPEILLRAQRGVLSRISSDMKKLRRWFLQPCGGYEDRQSVAPAIERMDITTVPLLAERWTGLADLLSQWEQRSLTRPRLTRLAYARIRKAEMRLRRTLEMAKWLGHFPPEALAYLERHGFRERRWHVLNLWLRVPQGRELFEELPALAWMLASSWLFRKPVTKPFRAARSLVRQPRAKILAWLNLPPGDGTIKLLRTVPGGACAMATMFLLQHKLNNATLRGWLLNLGMPLRSDILHFAFPGEITFPILRAVAKRERMPTFGARDFVSRVLGDIHSMLDMLGEDTDRKVLGRIHSTARLWEFHEELVAQMNLKERSQQSDWAAPKPPPVPYEEWMRPLDTPQALHEESRRQRHCLSSYEREVAGDRYYAFAIERAGERATLGIAGGPGRAWRIDQLRGFANAPASPALAEAVIDWAQGNHIKAAALSACDEDLDDEDFGFDDDDNEAPDDLPPGEIDPRIPRQLELAFAGGLPDDDDIPF